MNNDLFICRCGSNHHQFILTYDESDGILYVTMHLNSLPFWQRVIHGLCYIFGRKSIYGDFEEVLLDKTQIDELSTKLNNILDT
jgi:hypothetical protein